MLTELWNIFGFKVNNWRRLPNIPNSIHSYLAFKTHKIIIIIVKKKRTCITIYLKTTQVNSFHCIPKWSVSPVTSFGLSFGPYCVHFGHVRRRHGGQCEGRSIHCPPHNSLHPATRRPLIPPLILPLRLQQLVLAIYVHWVDVDLCAAAWFFNGM